MKELKVYLGGGVINQVETDSLYFDDLIFYYGEFSQTYSDTRPQDFYVSNCYPNPFNNSIKFDIYINQDRRVKVNIYDILGHQIKKIHDKEIL